jgi:predicted transposase/invertase (TIGR01784 family)
MDVFAREGSRVFDIEMQVSPEGRIGRRMRYYQAAIDATELGPGEDYGLLPESFVVFFCATDPFRAGKAIYSIERTCLELPGLVAGDGACSTHRLPRMSPTPTCAICYTTWRRGGPRARCPER